MEVVRVEVQDPTLTLPLPLSPAASESTSAVEPAVEERGTLGRWLGTASPTWLWYGEAVVAAACCDSCCDSIEIDGDGTVLDWETFLSVVSGEAREVAVKVPYGASGTKAQSAYSQATSLDVQFRQAGFVSSPRDRAQYVMYRRAVKCGCDNYISSGGCDTADIPCATAACCRVIA